MNSLRKLWSSGGGASVIAGAALCLALLAHGVTREVPLGNVDGMVTMRENGRPLPGATVIFRPEFDQEGQPKSRVFTVKGDGRYSLRNIPAGTYTVEAQARAHSMKETQVEIPEGAVTALQLELEPSEPYMELNASQHVFTPDEEPSSLLLSGFVKEDEVSIRVYKATDEQVVKANGIYGAFQSLSRWSDKADPEAALGKPVRTLSYQIKTRDGEGVFTDSPKLEKLPNGIYWVECKAGGITRGTYLNVTRLSLITKHMGGDVLCFATDITTGKPMQGVAVGFGKEGALVSKAVTDEKGVARFAIGELPSSNDILVAAKKDDSRAFVTFYSSQDHAGGGLRIFTYTDRPVYRPGDEVHFKGIVRKLNGNDFALPAGGTVEVKVLDEGDSLLSKQTLPLSQMGSYHGSFKFNRESPPGMYRIVTRYGEAEETYSFEIAAYRKPEFTVKVKGEKPFYVRGDRAKAIVECEYYFGGPVVGAKVTAYVNRSPYWSYMGEGGEEYFAEEGESGGEMVQEIEAVTDGQGRAVLQFDTKQEGDPDKASNDYLYTITASVEEGDKYFDGTGSVKVTRGEFAVEVSSDRYIVAPGESVEATVAAQWHDGEKPAAGRQIRVVLGQQIWNANEAVFHPLTSQTVTTGADGTATVKLSPSKGGSMLIKAVAEDDRGNEIEGEDYLYVDSYGAAESSGPMPKMTLKADKKQYNVGDTAKVLIQTDKPGGSAILTVEGDRIYSAQVVDLEKGSTVVEVPVTAEHAPNAFITIAYAKSKLYAEATEDLGVSIGKRKLKVAIASDKQSYKPGETATYTVTTTDEAGSPVPAEVSLGVVDESIYAIKKDTTDILQGFYPKRSNGVQTSYSFPELYLDGGDKTPANIEVRSKFLDTAFWQPSVMTDESGVATVQVPLPDNLTSWRATAIAASADTAVGQATLNVKARKDLMIRLQPPTFMVQGDTQVLTGTINNDSGKDADVNVELQVEGATIQGDLRQTVSVDAGEPATIEWTIRATRTGTASFTAKAWIKGGDADGVKHSISVQPHGRLVVEQKAGEISGTAHETLSIWPGADPNTGRLLITLSPSLASSLVQSLDGLIDYPYGCVEQTMSRFMPAVLVSQTLKSMGLPATPRSSEIPQIVRESYQRLKNMRGYKGGWGWWENDEPDPYMTAFVLEGIYRATAVGYGTTEIDINRATEWIKTSLKSKDAPKWRQSDRLYLIYALALHGEKPAAQHFLEQEKLDKAKASELAFACLIDKAVGNDVAAAEHLNRLVGQATVGAATAHWGEEEWYGYETTGRALQAVLAVNPKHPLVPKGVRYLMQQRRGDMWMSTRDTTVSLIALTQYLKLVEGAVKPTELVVTLNGQEIRRVMFDKQNLFNPDLKIEVPMSKLLIGKDNKLDMRSSGGACFYSLDLRQNVVQEQLGQVVSGKGLTIERRYYSLSPQKLQDGTMRLLQSGDAIREIESGQPVRCVLTIKTDSAREYMMIEDPLPSNCRVMERGMEDSWSWWYSQRTIFDDRITFFARTLPVGTHTIEYTMRSESAGVARALPAVLSNMYEPSVRTSSSENRLEVTTR